MSIRPLRIPMMLGRVALRQLGRANVLFVASLALFLLPPLLWDDPRRESVDGEVRGGSIVGAIQTNAWMFAVFAGVLGIALLWDAWRHRATDLLADGTGIRGVHALGEQRVAAWNEIDVAASSVHRSEGRDELVLTLHNRDAVTVARSIPYYKRGGTLEPDLATVMESLLAALRQRLGPPEAQGRARTDVARCTGCGAKLDLAALHGEGCPYCHTALALTPEWVERLAALRRRVEGAHARELQVRGLLDQPDASVANRRIAASAELLLATWLVGVAIGLRAVHDWVVRADIVALVLTGAFVSGYVVMQWSAGLLEQRLALKALSLGFAAGPQPPGETGARCRDGGASLTLERDSVMVACGYCGADNVLVETFGRTDTDALGAHDVDEMLVAHRAALRSQRVRALAVVVIAALGAAFARIVVVVAS